MKNAHEGPKTSGDRRTSSVGARFQLGRLNDWIDFYAEPGALETRPYRSFDIL